MLKAQKLFHFSSSIGAPISGADIWVEITHDSPSSPNNIWCIGSFNFAQDIAGGNVKFTPGTSDIWGFPDRSNTSLITASINSSSSLNEAYGRYFQKPIPNSLFKETTNIWELKVGDEFRFEDMENRSYMVQSFITPSNHPSGTLEVQLDGYIPTASVNLDHFLIRRYVEDASSILIKGSMPNGEESGEAFIRPEYITKPIDENIDESIESLTSKGLL